jgi:biopolymer transport protein ExbD
LWRQQHEARAHSQDDVVVLLCDEGVAYGLLHQVMQTAAEAGFVRFRMATRSP